MIAIGLVGQISWRTSQHRAAAKAVARLVEPCSPHMGHGSNPLHCTRLLGGCQQSSHFAVHTGCARCLLLFKQTLRCRDEHAAGGARCEYMQQHKQHHRPARAEHSADAWCRLACQVLDCLVHTAVGPCRPAQNCSQILLWADLRPPLCSCYQLHCCRTPGRQESRANASR